MQEAYIMDFAEQESKAGRLRDLLAQDPTLTGVPAEIGTWRSECGGSKGIRAWTVGEGVAA